MQVRCAGLIVAARIFGLLLGIYENSVDGTGADDRGSGVIVEYSRQRVRTLAPNVRRRRKCKEVEYSRLDTRTLVSLDSEYQDVQYSRLDTRTLVSLDSEYQDVEYSRLCLRTLNRSDI